MGSYELRISTIGTVPAGQNTSCLQHIIIMIDLIYVAQFDSNGVLTVLYIVIMYIQMQYVHI